MSVNKEENTESSRYSYYIDEQFYSELINRLPEWENLGKPVATAIERECQALLFQEARLLDDGKFDDWLALFTSKCLYWIPSNLDGKDPRKQVSIAFDDRRRLEDKVFWLQCGFAYAQTPRSRTSRIISNIEIFSSAKEEEVNIRSNFLIHEFRQGRMQTYAGWYGHRLQQQDGKWKIALKQVNLIDADRGHQNLSFLL
ncbi:MAG: aromatic-ring-hydroxylating dioxygenase subunit beta [Nostoc sp. ChiSLP02]|nr:aromatic-ring-hydroxylating dioxygenase subunit beta [Nostoc sp. DedSLP05]MDZ8098815.1 aromatic-ring-hydroxylating dioxygenase subunit beta [Nostoc sp. DedSLP01]MDZ8183571.1 aromatic-ring-hydroxylating dioxygenase subunit beta [Nostoc sp. ChiSLP02]